jgi:WD40 repeat protein
MGLAFSADSQRLLSVDAENNLRLWDLKNGDQPLGRSETPLPWASCWAFSPDCRRALSGNYAKTIKLWDAESGKELRHFEGHTEIVTCVAISPDGRWALSGSQDKTLRLWALPK